VCSAPAPPATPPTWSRRSGLNGPTRSWWTSTAGGALAAAERWAGPWAAFCPYPLALRSPDVPPFGPGLPPARGPFGQVRDRLLRPLVLGAIENTMLPPLNTVRAAQGLPPRPDLPAALMSKDEPAGDNVTGPT
jgi:hypothetical protein